MKRETSSGVILFREREDKREYLLLHNRADDWEFPKGGVEDGEELQQTAIREASEETGIEDIRLVDGFREAYEYIFEFSGETIHKKVHLFIGEVKSDSISIDLSKEHHDLQWRTYNQAVNTITHEEPRRIFRQAHNYLERERD